LGQARSQGHEKGRIDIVLWRGREISGEKKAQFRSRGRRPKQESESSIACTEEKMGRAMQEATADGSFDSSRNVFDDLYDHGDADIEAGTTFPHVKSCH